MTVELEFVTLIDGEREISERLALLGAADSDDGTRDRWHECRIYRASTGAFVAVAIGHSRRVGEVMRSRVHRTESAMELVELLKVRHRETDELFLPRPTLLALAQASGHDAKLHEAYLTFLRSQPRRTRADWTGER